MHQPESSDDIASPLRSTVTRRRAIATLGAIGLTGAVTRDTLGRQPATPEPDASASQEATMPDWRFSLIELQDPYEGDVTRPNTIPDAMRVVAMQVVLVNASQQPMEFAIVDIRLRDADGIEYRAGDFIGTEPRILNQNLPGGERTRGWVWVGLPETSELVAVVFVAPRPVLRIPIGLPPFFGEGRST